MKIKIFLLTIVIFSAKLVSANSEIPDTINFVVPMTVSDAPKFPVEQKVVELHMYDKPATENNKKRKKIEPLNDHATCSGAFIDAQGDILTAKHCTEGIDHIDVVTFDQHHYQATIVSTATVHDLALIHIDRTDTAYFEPADKVVRGETIFILGSPLGLTDTLSTGIVAHLDGDLMFVDCAALPGNSGGPVFNKDGEMVGVLTAGMIAMMGTTHLNVAQGLDAVKFFVSEALRHLR